MYVSYCLHLCITSTQNIVRMNDKNKPLCFYSSESKRTKHFEDPAVSNKNEYPSIYILCLSFPSPSASFERIKSALQYIRESNYNRYNAYGRLLMIAIDKRVYSAAGLNHDVRSPMLRLSELLSRGRAQQILPPEAARALDLRANKYTGDNCSDAKPQCVTGYK